MNIKDTDEGSEMIKDLSIQSREDGGGRRRGMGLEYYNCRTKKRIADLQWAEERKETSECEDIRLGGGREVIWMWKWWKRERREYG